MSDVMHVATRKGLFQLRRDARPGARVWEVERVSFLGDPVTAVLRDNRDGTLYAALNLGHFGVKMRRSDDGGKTWQEHATPAYPVQPENAAGPAWKLQLVWTLEPGGANEPGVQIGR